MIINKKSVKNRFLKAEWWELWYVHPGLKPQFVRMYGEPIPPWIPDGCYPTRALAMEDKKRHSKYTKVFHVKRFRHG